MKTLIVLLTAALVGCSGQPLPTYQQLQNYPLDCKKRADQIWDLKDILRLKFMDRSTEKLEGEDKAYHSLLKEHIWWFAYNCEQ